MSSLNFSCSPLIHDTVSQAIRFLSEKKSLAGKEKEDYTLLQLFLDQLSCNSSDINDRSSSSSSSPPPSESDKTSQCLSQQPSASLSSLLSISAILVRLSAEHPPLKGRCYVHELLQGSDLQDMPTPPPPRVRFFPSDSKN